MITTGSCSYANQTANSLEAIQDKFVVWDSKSTIQNIRTTKLERILINWGMSYGPV